MRNIFLLQKENLTQNYIAHLQADHTEHYIASGSNLARYELTLFYLFIF